MSEWIDNTLYPITDQHKGKVYLIRFVSDYNGITHTDKKTGEDYGIDLTWIRGGGEIHATSGVYKNEDLHSWKEI